MGSFNDFCLLISIAISRSRIFLNEIAEAGNIYGIGLFYFYHYFKRDDAAAIWN